MSLMASDSGGGDFKPAPAGVHTGRCYRVIDLGTQSEIYRATGEKKVARKVLIGWELTNEDADGQPVLHDDGKPFVIASRYTLSLHKKAKLRADLEAWRGRQFTDEELRGFDLQKLVGAYCLINVTHSTNNGKVYANVASLTPLPGKMPKPEPVNANQFFNVHEPDMQMFETFSNGIKDKIRACAEWQKGGPVASADGPSNGDDDDNIPF